MNAHAAHENYPDTHHDPYSKTIFGFWLYLLTDFIMFGAFFAAYAVLHNNTYGGPSSKDLFDLSYTIAESVFLLLAAFTSGIAGVYAHRRKKTQVVVFFLLTFLCGLAFLILQTQELSVLIENGNDWKRSAFLSSFFSIILLHSAHIVIGLLWTLVLLIPVLIQGVHSTSVRRLTCLRMFWQFLNLLWVFTCTLVYFLGAK